MQKMTEFKITEREIPGLLEIDVTLVEDGRGFFQEKFQKAKLVAAGFPESFVPVQENLSFNKEVGVTRGIHAEPWDKYISVVSGKVHAVFVDLRQGIDMGKHVEIVIDRSKSVFVPRGVGNSFQTLEPNTYYQYLINDHWSPDKKYLAVNLADPGLAIKWPIPLDQAIISEKDKSHPLLKDIYK
ncbi:MAG: dTDP-4-dehydrorhamnose 3,5-epimerase [Candidatus Doudnabacteria bacterium RIFCSPLOWO2_02_FULL_42_9]|uniref:dTDP-4-dehydrorhamnose 3,5-epimerase n=1 Tax=Candidatus Doudnabacteria bacterium RIFCSPHIGHO2_01_FULL_41_86 TaxID=1817821 RepID=A0A1F5N7N0_9BACT|nr:MAG: dTDP-4-dehydrorhamnose 3,5-epimerase [Candidatus Doudnabacteria bacterium RIFCSPHIGHO2_01_FULL_41_86]OGE74736.1 MAG: dTDP-4-dehydrorhamnose 3,5-epimerase [Candidatus Doudnabacteria bacterium RIFCSPHIGHO2_01_43_10]OGE85702.1 MAG: dTDP-4-dehydrorhamnose 3,5-epimerase [Candidatus Doudnabacteria bacterium RIFCSPHIGHO2_12_FULL_42_22]OGE87197.1 MAG: dTDP-4-dehydrorhamnose 3,5-epimerase [Candidatus Doudnabacteria bacterium RIFCSPHIGHO2_02_FULL_42_25]OGE92035.1 MAG: dTDP-4-dehydrorhamnose 3,5-e